MKPTRPRSIRKRRAPDGSGTVNSAGYRRMRLPPHPLARPDGSILEHRKVLFDELGDGCHPCHWCSRLLDWRTDPKSADFLQVDHLDADRLNNEPRNLVAACKACNTERRHLGNPREFAPGVTRVEMFWTYVTKTESCWVWSGALDVHGLGRFWGSGSQQSARRIAFELTIRPLAPGEYVLTECGEKNCVRPDHMRIQASQRKAVA